LRTALRVLKPLWEFKARDENELYKGAYNIEWSSLISGNQTFAIDGVLNSPYFNHSRYVALRVKDAIVDQFRTKTGRRPGIDTDEPDIRLNLHISGDKCTLLLDSSGDSLHRRGYREATHEAPLNEVLAAGIIMMSGWDRRSPFVDPMCGSGTIPLEAAMMAWNIYPGMYRKQFAFEKWPDFDDSLLDKIYNQEHPEPAEKPVIIGADMSARAVAIARNNGRNAFLGKKIEFKVSSFENLVPPEGPGVLVTNPPYGERIKQENLKAFHSIMGDVLKNKYPGYSAWILSSNTEALKFTGLRPEKKTILFNGALECRLVKYSVYKGSRKSPD
jgi:putative N6-adenine-specific DNA methylase